MALRDFSKPGSWTYRLYDILRPAPHPMAIQFANSQTRFRHLKGDIWRHALSCSVYHDLAEESQLKGNADRTTGATAHCRTWRRFVRMECIGISGLLFYEIRKPTLSGSDSQQIRERRSSSTGKEESGANLTLESVFGDPDDPSDAGMEVDDLLDAVYAKVVYFPAYACTSFIIGQVMTAFLRDQPSFRPHPAPEGFSVPSFDTIEDVHSPSVAESVSIEIYQRPAAESDLVSMPSYSWQTFCSDLPLHKLTLEADDPHITLCVRSSVVSDAKSSCLALSDEEEGNTTSSTIESVGPPTPPGTHSRDREDLFTSIEHPFSGKSLLLDTDDRTIGLNLLINLKPFLGPSVSSAPTSADHTSVPIHHRLTSFLDLSTSHARINEKKHLETSNS